MPPQSLIPFGKYKGQPTETLLADPDYAQWLMAQDWFSQRYPQFHTFIIHHGGEPEETPEHNALQLRFLDEGLRQKLFALLFHTNHDDKKWTYLCEVTAPGFEVQGVDVRYEGSWSTASDTQSKTLPVLGPPQLNPEMTWQRYVAKEWVAQQVPTVEDEREKLRIDKDFYKRNPWATREAILQKQQASIDKFTQRQPFREDPILKCLTPDKTAFFWPVTTLQTFTWNSFWCRIFIECKPSLGDDYPAVLRTIRQRQRGRQDRGCHDHEVLVAERYAFRGGSVADVQEFLRMSGVTLLLMSDIEQQPAPLMVSREQLPIVGACGPERVNTCWDAERLDLLMAGAGASCGG